MLHLAVELILEPIAIVVDAREQILDLRIGQAGAAAAPVAMSSKDSRDCDGRDGRHGEVSSGDAPSGRIYRVGQNSVDTGRPCSDLAAQAGSSRTRAPADAGLGAGADDAIALLELAVEGRRLPPSPKSATRWTGPVPGYTSITCPGPAGALSSPVIRPKTRSLFIVRAHTSGTSGPPGKSIRRRFQTPLSTAGAPASPAWCTAKRLVADQDAGFTRIDPRVARASAYGSTWTGSDVGGPPADDQPRCGARLAVHAHPAVVITEKPPSAASLLTTTLRGSTSNQHTIGGRPLGVTVYRWPSMVDCTGPAPPAPRSHGRGAGDRRWPGLSASRGDGVIELMVDAWHRRAACSSSRRRPRRRLPPASGERLRRWRNGEGSTPATARGVTRNATPTP